MNNPYLELLNIMDKSTQIPQTFYLGVVKSKLPNLVIYLNNIELTTNDFLICSNLLTLNNANIEASCTCSNVECDCSTEIEHNLKNELDIDDRVLFVNVDDTLILVDKVVSI